MAAARSASRLLTGLACLVCLTVATAQQSFVEQVKLLPTEDLSSSIVVSFAALSTAATLPDAVVAYRELSGDQPVGAWQTATGGRRLLSFGMAVPVWLYDSRVSGLKPATRYQYVPGGLNPPTNGVYNFTTHPATPCSQLSPDGRTCASYRPMKFGVLADAGLANFVTLPALVDDAASGALDAVAWSGE